MRELDQFGEIAYDTDQLEPDWFEKAGDRAAVLCAIDPFQVREPANLHPKNWEPLRIELQKIWRRATGETQAVLIVEEQQS